MYGTNASTAAAYYGTGIGGYSSAAWSFPYAPTDNLYGNSSVGFGLMNEMNYGPMNGMTDGFSSIAVNEFNFPRDGFAEAERSSTDTTPRTRSRSKKSQSRLKHRSKRIAGRSLSLSRPRSLTPEVVAHLGAPIGVYSKDTGSGNPTLKGPNNPARVIALGTRQSPPPPSPEGARQRRSPRALPVCRPFRARGGRVRSSPGRCPGPDCSAPSGRLTKDPVSSLQCPLS